ncbi:hypothetical protein U0023_34720 (plasmid) [Microvirga lotononidis]|uniref:Uncharacterized protein n=1 Tax=Microvirga lotononidis TaxID=864069 RepID=I4YSE7_9HYPH|nr:hypothetical protein [Microvirga lotononidis]EIM26889.1 hypothetical protein MicloDRAFT_00034400 [Microvirga lotononidis]WQO31440.1 hypothetical protein U0023_34720 [Microvirga lotononidis]
MQRRFKIQGVKEAALHTDDLKAPSAPIVTAAAIGVPQFVNGGSRQGRSHLKIKNVKTRVVPNRFSTVDEMEKAAHRQSFLIRDMDAEW